ncbi:hypothetical protein GCM10027610_021340 [Dactylosporangium cerinum]
MEIDGSVALVTGANRGLGLHIARELLARGATVYATARDPRTVDLPGATVLPLDVTDPASVRSPPLPPRTSHCWSTTPAWRPSPTSSTATWTGQHPPRGDSSDA